MKKDGRVYDKEWNTWFSCEEERQDFIRAIAEAEEDERQEDGVCRRRPYDLFEDLA